MQHLRPNGISKRESNGARGELAVSYNMNRLSLKAQPHRVQLGPNQPDRPGWLALAGTPVWLMYEK